MINPRQSLRYCTGLFVLLAVFGSVPVVADDWPMWRYDAHRSASSPNTVPEVLSPIWAKKLGPRQQAWDDPLNLDLMTYDRVFEPIVMDGKLIIGFNDRDKVVALDAATGSPSWTFYTQGPVRLPPVGWRDRLFICSDDGYLYCVDVRSGALQWKFRGAANAQQAIGNRRVISAWPARGGPVVRDDTVYFAASIWPFMGTFIYALDAESGQTRWVNDRTGAQYIKQPHSAPSFAGVAPQGALVATEDWLVVPGGRSVPAVFDRRSGELQYFEINAGGKGTGGSFVSASEQHFYVHTRLKGTRAFELSSGVKTAFMPNEPVIDGETIYAAESTGQQRFISAYGSDQKLRWQIEADGSGDLIRAGDHLIAAGENAITIVHLPTEDRPASISNRIPVEANIQRLLVADQKLFAVTLDGQILAFGSPTLGEPSLASVSTQSVSEPDLHGTTGSPAADGSSDAWQLAEELLAAGDAEGYAFWFGNSQSAVVRALCRKSPFEELVIVDPTAESVEKSRRWLDRAGLLGRVSVHASEPSTFMPPRNVAHAVYVQADSNVSSSLIAKLYEAVRPYGGVLYLIVDHDLQQISRQIKALPLEQAEVEVAAHGILVRRVGALPGSADWTHQYGDVANTIKSDDRRVKLPLGVLWFGGSSNMDVLPRHGHGPPEQVIGGRLFIQGINSLSARDVYTGRVLWKREFDDLDTFDVYYDKTYEDTPLNPKYNQVHIPGANGRGTNYVVTEDRVYMVEGDVCHVLDPANGKTVGEIRLPDRDDGAEVDWGYVGVYKNVLLGGYGFARYRQRHGLSFESDKKLRASKAGFGSKSLDRAASLGLVAFDRHSGEVLWTVEANHSFWHNGIIAGGDQVYCLDKNPSQVEQAMRRRGLSLPDSYRIVALDYRTGKQNWEINEGIFGTWLGYSQQHDLLLQAGAAASDRLAAETGTGMAVHSAYDGSVVWKKESLKYTGPCILHNDWIITNTNSYAESAGAFLIRDGTQKMVPNPITGKMQPWKLTRAYGCNSIIASENLLTFRSGAAGYYDLLTHSGTGNLGGFKSGCTSNLVVANGVLNAPDYTRTCSCAYQNQTSLALVHMPEVELWSVNTAASVQAHGKRIDRVGINFGAPGDRRDTEGLLWIEYPVAAGPSPPLSVELNPTAKPFRSHSSRMEGNDLSWILTSGVQNVTELRVALRLKDEFDLQAGVPVGHSDDDAVEADDGTMHLGSRELELAEGSGSGLVGLRFADVKLERNAEIREAYIQFTCDRVSPNPASLIITAEASAKSRRFSQQSHDLSSREKTTAEVGWKPPPWLIPGAAAPAQRTANLAPLVESVIRQKDWQPGNPLTLLISGSGHRIASSFERGSDKAPKLVVHAQSDQDSAGAVKAEHYRVRLMFALPPTETVTESVFDVYSQGVLALSGVHLKRTDPAVSFAIETLENVMIGDELQLRFDAKQGNPVLSGLELIRQDRIQQGGTQQGQTKTE